MSYCSITSPEPKLHYFSETLSTRSGPNRQFHTATIGIDGLTNPIIYLELLHCVNKENALLESRLLTIQADGVLRCYSEDLQFEEWKGKIITGSQASNEPREIRIEFALVISVEEAVKSLLKDREDVLAVLENRADKPDTCLLLLVTRYLYPTSSDDGSLLRFRIIHISATKGSKRPFQELSSLSLTEPNPSNGEKYNYSWQGLSGSLLQNTTTTFTVYKIGGLVPRLVHHWKIDNSKIGSCLQLSPSEAIISTANSVSVVDIKFHSLQVEYAFETLFKYRSKKDKHKHKRSNKHDLQLLSYYTPLDIVIALQGCELIALQLPAWKEHKTTSRKRGNDGLLVDSIARGHALRDGKSSGSYLTQNLPKSLGACLPYSQPIVGWKKQKALLDGLIASGQNLDEVERILMNELDVAEEEIVSNRGQRLDSTFGAGEKHIPDLRKFNYFLTKIFTIEKFQKSAASSQDIPNGKLKISWFPDKICRWMIRRGFFSKTQIETSLKHYGALPASNFIAIGAFTQAVAEWDTSLELLQFILENPVPLDPYETVHVLRYMLKNMKTADDYGSEKLLTNGSGPDTAEHDQALNFPKTALLENPMPHLQANDNNILQRLLQGVICRLQAQSKSMVSRALKDELSLPELRLLVDLLRVRLAQFRWLSHKAENTPQPSNNGFSSESQEIALTNFFICVIDSIGTSGWVLGASMSEDLIDTADTIAYMKAEVSAAMHGAEEATYLESVLGEVLLFGKNAHIQGHYQFGRNSAVVKMQFSALSTIGNGNALPLGLKLAQNISTKKVGVGGEIRERSKRDIGRLKSRTVGKHSFDRIVI